MQEYISKLLDRNEMRIVDREVNPKHELAAVVARSQKESALPILFKRVQGTEFPVVCNLYGSRSRLKEMVGAGERGFCEHWAETINDAMLLGDDYPTVVDMSGELQKGQLSDLPQIVWREKDAGPYITAGVAIAKDPETGVPNLAFSRAMMIDDKEMRCCIDVVQDLAKYHAKAAAMNKPLEMAWLIGVSPAVFMAACTSISLDQDELKIAAQLNGGALPMRHCQELDLLIPADTGIVIEARIRPDERRPEAPFGEFMGYYCKENRGYVADIAAVSWRPGSYFQGLLCGSRDDLTAIYATYATRVYRNLIGELPGIIDVACNTTLYCTIVKIDKQYEGHPQHVMLKVFATNPHYNFACMVVDSDIDINNLNDVWWAFLARGPVDKRTMLIDNIPGGYEYPEDNLHRGRIGIDATAPYGRLDEFRRTSTPGEDTLNLSDYFA